MDVVIDALAYLATMQNLLLLVGGTAAGIFIGAMPGLSVNMGLALLFPITFSVGGIGGIVTLLGIYCGAIYGGSITAILLKTPGTPASAATTMDGYPMAVHNGEPGRALSISTMASTFGGVFSCICLILFAPILASVALQFSKPEYFALAIFGISMITSVSGSSILKGLIACLIGLFIATIGLDAMSGMERFTAGSLYLTGGISFMPVLIGLFAISQVFLNVEEMMRKQPNQHQQRHQQQHQSATAAAATTAATTSSSNAAAATAATTSASNAAAARALSTSATNIGVATTSAACSADKSAAASAAASAKQSAEAASELANAETAAQVEADAGVQVHRIKIKSVLPSLKDIKLTLVTMFRSSAIGTFIGCVPGTGGDISSWISYDQAKRWSKDKSLFGKGDPRGIAASESGNNSIVGGAFIPVLTLGIPGDGATAIILGALMVHGLQPGPLLFMNNALDVYSIFIAMLAANIVMGLFGFSLIRLFIKVVAIPRVFLLPIIVVMAVIGTYSYNHSMSDVYVMLGAGIIGYFMAKTNVGVPGVIIGIILGSLAEQNFTGALIMSDGSLSIFAQSPICAAFLVFSLLSLLSPLYKSALSALLPSSQRA